MSNPLLHLPNLDAMLSKLIGFMAVLSHTSETVVSVWVLFQSASLFFVKALWAQVVFSAFVLKAFSKSKNNHAIRWPEVEISLLHGIPLTLVARRCQNLPEQPPYVEKSRRESQLQNHDHGPGILTQKCEGSITPGSIGCYYDRHQNRNHVRLQQGTAESMKGAGKHPSGEGRLFCAHNPRTRSRPDFFKYSM